MFPEIIVCSKTMSCRLEEYQNLLEDVDTPCSEINEIWSTIFEGLAIVNVGWMGLWVLSPRNCKKYSVLYPTVVIVKVNDFKAQNLTATVTVEGVQDDIILPTVVDVPIIELHPIKNQNYDEWNLKCVADWFDKCRYFFKYLWYPWDGKENVKMSDWCAVHLANRLQLQYDAKSGVLNEFARNYLKSLLEESEEINETLLNMPTDVNDQEQKLQLVHHYIRRKMIKVELDLLEEPELRYRLIITKEYENNLSNPPRKSNKGEAKLVWTSGTANDFLKYMELAKNLINDDTTVKVSDSLQNAFDKSRQDDIILVNPEEHLIKSIGNMKYGGVIKGVSSLGAVIKPDPSRLKRVILFDCYGFLTLENLTIVREEGICIQVCQNTLKISNCKISAEDSALAKGIVVLANCSLEVENCEFKGFATAIILHKGAVAKISNTRIHDCVDGIRVGDESKLSLNNVEISSCSNYGLRIESLKSESETPLTGNIDILEGNVDIKFESVLLTANRKGNVIIKKVRDDRLIESEDDADESRNTIYLSDEDSDDFEDSVDITEKNSHEINVDESGDHDESV